VKGQLLYIGTWNLRIGIASFCFSGEDHLRSLPDTKHGRFPLIFSSQLIPWTTDTATASYLEIHSEDWLRTNDHGYVPSIVIIIQSFPHLWLTTESVTRVRLRAPTCNITAYFFQITFFDWLQGKLQPPWR
jgi:hypothetical protein